MELIFNDFANDSASLSPTQKDHDFATALAAASAGFYKSEENRRQKLLEVFNRYDLPLQAGQIGRAKTDADLDVGEDNYKAMVVEIKNDATTGDPVMQTGHYFNRSFETKRELIATKKSIFPCLGMYLQGTVPFCTLLLL